MQSQQCRGSASLPTTPQGSTPKFGLLDVPTCHGAASLAPHHSHAAPLTWGRNSCWRAHGEGCRRACWKPWEVNLEVMSREHGRSAPAAVILQTCCSTSLRLWKITPNAGLLFIPSRQALGGLPALVSTQMHALQGITPCCSLSDTV